jgi:hypothetical protein
VGNAIRTVWGWVPLTWFGLFAIPILIGVLRAYGIGRRDGVVLALAFCGLALQACSTLLVVLTALWLRVRRQRHEPGCLTLEAGTPYRTGYVVRRVHWNPLLRVELAWERPEGVNVQGVPGRGGLHEEATATERALRDEVVRRITVTDILGLARITFRRRLAQPLQVLPGCGQVKPLQLLQQNIPGDQVAYPEGQPAGDFIEMRRYTPGDPLKLVLWKVYARTRRMLVRTPERAIAPCEKTLAYLVAADGDEPAAGIARAVLENGSLGTDFLFSANGAEAATRNVQEAVEQLVRSVNARDEGGRGLGAFLAHGESQGIRACILFVSGRPGAWLNRVAQQVAGNHGPFRVIIGVDGIETGRRGWLRRLLLTSGGVDPRCTPITDVRRVYDRLLGLGAEVCVVNRATGTILTSTEIVSPLAA